MGLRSWWNNRQSRKWAALAASTEGTSIRSEAPRAPRFTAYLGLGGIDIPATLSFAASDLTALLTAAAWSYSAMVTTARQVASLAPIVQRRGTGAERWIPDLNHPLNDLIQRPHGPPTAPPNWSWGQLIEGIMLHLQAHPRGACLKVSEFAGKPVALHLLSPGAIRVREDLRGLPLAYHYGAAEYSPASIVHLTLAHPTSYTLSTPPLAAALRAVGIDQLAESRQHANLLNKVSPGLVVAVAGIQGLHEEMQDEQIAYLQKNWSLANQDGRPMVIGDGTKLLAPPLTTQQLAYGETRRMSTEQILAAFGVPGQLLGAKAGPTYASVAEARKIWYDTSIFPYLGVVYGALNRQLVARLYGDEVRIWFDITGSPIALDLLTAKIAAAQALVNMGFPANLAAAHVGLGLPHVEGLDTPNTKQVIAGRSDSQPTPAAADAEPDDGDGRTQEEQA